MAREKTTLTKYTCDRCGSTLVDGKGEGQEWGHITFQTHGGQTINGRYKLEDVCTLCLASFEEWLANAG